MRTALTTQYKLTATPQRPGARAARDDARSATQPAPRVRRAAGQGDRGAPALPAPSTFLRFGPTINTLFIHLAPDDLITIRPQEHEEDLRLAKKAEKKFVGLLEDTFYLSDHVGIPWDEAKKKLQKRSAYDVVTKTERKQ